MENKTMSGNPSPHQVKELKPLPWLEFFYLYLRHYSLNSIVYDIHGYTKQRIEASYK